MKTKTFILSAVPALFLSGYLYGMTSLTMQQKEDIIVEALQGRHVEMVRPRVACILRVTGIDYNTLLSTLADIPDDHELDQRLDEMFQPASLVEGFATQLRNSGVNKTFTEAAAFIHAKNCHSPEDLAIYVALVGGTPTTRFDKLVAFHPLEPHGNLYAMLMPQVGPVDQAREEQLATDTEQVVARLNRLAIDPLTVRARVECILRYTSITPNFLVNQLQHSASPDASLHQTYMTAHLLGCLLSLGVNKTFADAEAFIQNKGCQTIGDVMNYEAFVGGTPETRFKLLTERPALR